ncbi:hypothetical protein [Streptomyces sp. KLOTTS4A1]|uniref:hypothetical protein n=1 Tax=Streptomyces sp. KLOTTS4A1 TaxID=3390996 RepID=UPI0039F570BE
MSTTSQVRTVMDAMAYGQPAEVTSYWASVKKLARIAALAERFGYQYADVVIGMQGLKMLLVPDPDPQARQRAQQAWAQHPPGAGAPLPQLPTEVPELLRNRIRFDMYATQNEKRRLVAVPVAFVIVALQMQRTPDIAVFWGVLLGVAVLVAGGSFLVRRKWRGDIGRRLQAMGFVPLNEPNGRLRLVPPGSPYAPQAQAQAQAYGQPQPQGYGQPQPYVQPQPYGNGQPQLYGTAQPYGQPQAQQPHSAQPHQAPPQHQQPGGAHPQQPHQAPPQHPAPHPQPGANPQHPYQPPQ